LVAILFDHEHKVAYIAKDLELDLLRPSDFLSVKVKFIGFAFEHHIWGKTYLVPASKAKVPTTAEREAATIVFTFSPQVILEECGTADSTHIIAPNRPVGSRLAGESRLAFNPFKDNPGIKRIAFDFASIFNWSNWPIAVANCAAPPTQEDGTFTCDGRLPWNFTYKNPDIKAPSEQALQAENVPVGPPHTIGESETSIELPYGLILSPNRHGRFAPISGDENPLSHRLGLWHCALDLHQQSCSVAQPENGALEVSSPVIMASSKSTGRFPTVRFIATREPDPACNPPLSGYQPMCANDRDDLTKIFSQFRDDSGQPQVAPAMPVSLLVLSSQGGWLRGSIDWAHRTNINLSGVLLRFAQRHNEKTVLCSQGFLMPTGHPATLVKETRRRWLMLDSRMFSVEIQVCYIQIERKTIEYPAVAQPNQARDCPFRAIDITVERTPFLDAAPVLQGAQCKEVCNLNDALWPQVGGRDYRFPIQCIDHEGLPHTSTMACKWVPVVHAWDQPMQLIADARQYNQTAAEDWCHQNGNGKTVSDFAGQRIAFAVSSKPGDTRFAVERFYWHLLLPANINLGIPADECQAPGAADGPNAALQAAIRDCKGNSQAPWFPVLGHAQVDLDSVTTISRPDITTSAFIRYSELYRDHGFPSDADRTTNPGEAFLAILQSIPGNANAGPQLGFAGAASGGLATPSARLCGISRRFGPVGGKDDNALKAFAGGSFDPKQFFLEQVGTTPGAQLFGAIDLASIVSQIVGIGGLSDAVPKLVQTEIRDAAKSLAVARQKLEQAKDTIDTVRKGFEEYARAAHSFADQLRATAIQQPLANLDKLLNYVDIPDEFRTNAEVTAERVRAIQNDFHNQILLASDLSTVREYVLAKLASQAGVTAVTIANLRKTFRDAQLQAAKRIALVGTRFDSIADHLQQQFFGSVLMSLLGGDLGAIIGNIAALRDQLTLLPTTPVAIRNLVRLELDGLKQQLLSSTEPVKKDAIDQLANIKAAIIASGLQAEQDLTQKLNDLMQKAVDTETERINQVANSILGTASAVRQQFEQALANDVLSRFDQAQQLLSTVNALIQSLNVPQALRLNYEFRPQLHDDPSGLFLANRNGVPAKMVLATSAVKRFDGTAPSWTTNASLQNFTLRLLPSLRFLELHFQELSFRSENGQAPSVGVKLADVKLLGPLDFINGIQEYIKKLDSSVGLYLDHLTSGVAAGVRFRLPNITAGAFSLTNVSFASGVTLPFDGSAVRARFSFGTRSQPCLGAIGIFGATAFVALEVNAKEVVEVEAALEYGAVAQLDIAGVAHGSAQLMGGFYFRRDGQGLLVSGYFRASGEISVLGLVSMSLQFWLMLSYEDRNHQAFLVGECTLSVDIHIGFFSVGVSMTMRREFSRSSQSAAMAPSGARENENVLVAGLQECSDDSAFDLSTAEGPTWCARHLQKLQSYAW
jgi:hypothetical protein